jgi:repressor of nif and glnA expression
MKKTVNEAILEVLKDSKGGLNAKEIYQRIKDRKLYDFKSENPENIVRNQLRRHSENLPENKVSSKVKHYVFDSGKFRAK